MGMTLSNPTRLALRTSILAALLSAAAMTAHGLEYPVAATPGTLKEIMPHANAYGPALETYLQGPRMVFDWSTDMRGSVRFRVLRPDGRVIASRLGRRTVQGWITSVRVAGWPRGVYLIEAESGTTRSTAKFLLP